MKIHRIKLKTRNLLIFLPARQFNDQEFLIVNHELKKHGFAVFIASDTAWMCEGINGLKVKADMNIFNIHVNNFAGIILIGGAGARKYRDNQQLQRIIKKFNEEKKIVAAICSAPVILAQAGILKNIAATCFYEDKTELINAGADFKPSPVISRKNIITAEGPKASADFADAIIFKLNELLIK